MIITMMVLWLLFLSLFLATVDADHIDPVANARAGGGNFVLNLLHVNDHHSHLEEAKLNIPLTNIAKRARTIYYGGYPRLVTLLKTAQRKWTNVIKIHAGDALVGTGFYRLFGTAPDLDMFHQVCFDVFNIGNHEHDDGDNVLAGFVDQLTNVNSPCQNTRVLSANLKAGRRSPLRPLQQQGYIAPHVIRSFPNGNQVAFIGINIRNKTLSGSQPDRGTTLTDERSVIRQQIRLLEQVGINKIILISHLGIAKDRNWVTRLEGVDAVIGAHSHTLLATGADAALNPHSRYPNVIYQRKSGKMVCIGHAWKFGHGAGRLRVEFDENGDVIHCGGSFLIPFEPNPKATNQDAATMTQHLEGLGQTFVRTKQDPVALNTLRFYTDQMHGKQMFDTVLIKQADPLCREDIPGQGRSDLCTKQETAAHGGMACQLVAHALLNQTVEADVAIHNAGGCQADIMGGDFTYGQAIELLPYSDTLVVLDMTGWQILLVLEQAIELALAETDSSGSYPYASGLRFGVNASKEFGFRVSHLQLNSRLAKGVWNDIDFNRNYTVVTNSFLAAGKDGYLEFANVTSRHDMRETYLGAFISYIEEYGIAIPDTEAMSTQNLVGQPTSTEEDAEEFEEVKALLDLEDSKDELGAALWIETDPTGQENNSSDAEETSTDERSWIPVLEESWPPLVDENDAASSYVDTEKVSWTLENSDSHLRSSSSRPWIDLWFPLAGIAVVVFWICEQML